MCAAFSLASLGLLPDASFDDARLWRAGVRSVDVTVDDPAYPLPAAAHRLQKDEEIEHDGEKFVIVKKREYRHIVKPRISDYMTDDIQNALNAAACEYQKECDKSGIAVSDKDFPSRRQLREEWERHRIQWDRVAKRVGRGGAKVLQNDVLEHKIFRKKKTLEFAASQVMTCANGEQMSLLSVMNNSKKNLFAERYKFITALSSICEQDKLSWGMLTLTTSPEHHPSPKNGGNSFNDSITVRDSQNWIHEKWRKVLRRLANHEVTISGFRCVEFHEDSTPHWHILFYYHKADSSQIFAEVKKEWTLFDPENPEKSLGAHWIKGDNSKSKFASYASKYVLKSMSQGLDDDIDLDCEEDRTSLAYESLRSPYHIRGLQFFGLPSIGLWRSLRAMKDAPITDSQVVLASWRAARGGDAVGFIGLQGGLAVATKKRPLKGKICREEGSKFVEIVDKTNGEYVRFDLPIWTRSANFKAASISKNSGKSEGWHLSKVIQVNPKTEGQKRKADGKRSLDFLIDDDSPSFFT